MNWDTFTAELAAHVIENLNSEAELLDFDDPNIYAIIVSAVNSWVFRVDVTCEEDFYDLGAELGYEIGKLAVDEHFGIAPPSMCWGQELLQFFFDHKEECSYEFFDVEGQIEESDPRALHEIVTDSVNLVLRARAAEELWKIQNNADLESMVFDFAVQWGEENLA